MKKYLALIALMANVASAQGFDSIGSEIYLNAFTRFTPEYRRATPFIEAEETDSALIKKLKLELLKCGVSLTEKNCLDSTEIAGNTYTFKKLGEDGYRYFLKGIKDQYDDYTKAVQVVRAHAENQTIIFDELALYEIRILDNYSSLKNFFFGLSVEPRIKVNQFQEHLFESYRDQINNADDSKTLYHLTLLARNSAKTPESIEELKTALVDKIEIASQTEDAVYQNEWMELLSKDEIYDLESYKIILNRFIESRDEDVAIKAAYLLGQRSQSSGPIKELINKGLGKLSFKTQIESLNGLFNIREGLEDDLIIINTMKSSTKEVSEEAFRLAKLMELTVDHLETIKSLFNTPADVFRLHAIDLVAKIEAPQADELLVKLLGDPSEKVANKSFHLIKQKDLTPESIGVAKSLREHPLAHSRYFSLFFIAKEKNIESYKLVHNFLTDFDEKVSDTATNILMDAELEFLDKSLLKEVVGKKRSRKRAIRILSRFEDTDTINFLIETIKELSKDDIEYTYKLLKNKKLDTNNLYSLKKTYMTLDPDTKEAVIKLMAKIEDQKTLDWAKDMRRRTFLSKFKTMLDKLIEHLKEKLNS